MDGRCCGRRVKGTVVQFVEYNSRIYKVVYEKDDIFWLISFENPAAPFPASKENLILQEMPAEYMDETPASAKRNTTMEKRLKILDEMVYDDRCCHDVAHRNRVVKKIAKDNGLSEKTILRWYYAYLAKGKRGLLPAARIHEIVEAPEEAGMKRAISRYYYSPVKMSLRGAYEMYLMDECRTEDGRLQDERPPFSKFKSVYNKMRSDYRKIISRQGIGEFQKNYRPLLGQAVDVAPLCGHFEMDATSADIELVSKYSRQSVGRPYVYLVVDVFSRLIAGFYVDFNTNTDAVLMCIRSLLQDKVEIARKRGVTIAPDAWPTTGLPCEITFDKGKDFMGERTKELCELFNIEITNLPAYRPDLKGCVERAFGEVQGMYMNLLHGHGTYEKVNTRLGLNSMHSTPCLDIDEYINTIVSGCTTYFVDATGPICSSIQCLCEESRYQRKRGVWYRLYYRRVWNDLPGPSENQRNPCSIHRSASVYHQQQFLCARHRQGTGIRYTDDRAERISVFDGIGVPDPQ